MKEKSSHLVALVGPRRPRRPRLPRRIFRLRRRPCSTAVFSNAVFAVLAVLIAPPSSRKSSDQESPFVSPSLFEGRDSFSVAVNPTGPYTADVIEVEVLIGYKSSRFSNKSVRLTEGQLFGS